MTNRRPLHQSLQSTLRLLPERASCGRTPWMLGFLPRYVTFLCRYRRENLIVSMQRRIECFTGLRLICLPRRRMHVIVVFTRVARSTRWPAAADADAVYKHSHSSSGTEIGYRWEFPPDMHFREGDPRKTGPLAWYSTWPGTTRIADSTYQLIPCGMRIFCTNIEETYWLLLGGSSAAIIQREGRFLSPPSPALRNQWTGNILQYLLALCIKQAFVGCRV